MSDSRLTRSSVVLPEEFEKHERLKTGVYKDEVGRTWVEDVESLSTHAITVLIAELRRSPHTSSETVRAARRAAELVVRDRLARQQIEAPRPVAQPARP